VKILVPSGPFVVLMAVPFVLGVLGPVSGPR
jgi:hypothetical protein